MNQSQESRAVRDHFDRMGSDGSYAQFYVAKDSPLTHDFLARMARVEELLSASVTPGHSTLDLGCGTGPMVEYFCSRGARYHGVDLAPAMVKSISQRFSATKYGPKITLTVAAGDGIPYPPDYFDSVVAMGLIEYLEDPKPTLSEIARVVKPGGLAVITVPNRLCLNRFTRRHAEFVTRSYHLWKRLGGQTVSRKSGVTHREFAPRTFDRLVNAHGFQAVGRAFYDYRFICYPLTRIAPTLAFRINSLFENRGPAFLANGYIGVYRREGPTS